MKEDRKCDVCGGGYRAKTTSRRRTCSHDCSTALGRSARAAPRARGTRAARDAPAPSRECEHEYEPMRPTVATVPATCSRCGHVAVLPLRAALWL